MHIVVDIGGTKTRVAASRDFETFGEPIIFPTPQNYDAALRELLGVAAGIRDGAQIDGIAIGAPGVISRDKRVLIHAPNLPGWDGVVIADDVARAMQTRVLLENDTALVGLGEATRGAGLGATILAYITISTGVNGVRIVDGSIDRAAYGFEIGEQYLGADATARTFEELVSGRAIGERFGLHPRELGKDHPVWGELAQITARALHNTIAYWSPERIVIGGSMMNDIGIPIDRIRACLHELPRKNPALPNIVHAALGDFGGLWGGLARLREARSARPQLG